MKKLKITINIQGSSWQTHDGSAFAKWLFSKLFDLKFVIAYKNADKDAVFEYMHQSVIPARRGRIVTATHPEWSAEKEKIKGGRIVKNMPYQLKKIRKSQENGNMRNL